MANYNVSSLNLSIKEGGSTGGSGQLQVPSSGTITITPKPGFVVQASDFSVSVGAVNSTNPISSTNLADSGTALDVNNTVVVTLTFNSGFSMPTADTIKNLTIGGNARVLTDTGLAASTDFNLLNQTNPFNIVIRNNLEIELNTDKVISDPLKITNITSLNDGITVGSVGDGISDISVSGNVNFNPDLLGNLASVSANTGSFNRKAFVKAFKFTVSADSGKIIKNLRFRFEGFTSSTPEDSIIINDESVTENSSGEPTSATFVVGSNVKRPIFSGVKLILHGTAGTPRPTTKKIYNLTFGSSSANPLGTTRSIEVYGDVGAEFDIRVFEVGNESNILFEKVNQKIPTLNKNIEFAQNFKKYRLEIPATTTQKSYQILVKPVGDTELSGQLGDFHANAKPVTITQFIAPVFKIAYTRQTSPSPGYPALTETIITGKANTSAKSLRTTVPNFESVRLIKHVIVTTTGQFTYNSSNLTITNSNLFQTGAISGTDYVAHSYDPKIASLSNFKGAVSNTSTTNDTFTLEFVLELHAFDQNDLTYQIDLSQFLTHGS
tara:strand:- start:94 stop:1746 length:1653 start_codon:yes stop_codon:yes gene_type:complete